MANRVVYWNGSFIPEPDARVSIFDSALMFGDMVFEMTRTFGQKTFRLREHLERLYASLDYVEIDCGLTIDEMESATHETIERNLPELEGLDFQVMHDVTRGSGSLYDTLVKEGTAPIVSINTMPLVRHLAGVSDHYTKGAHLVITPQQAVPARYIDPKAKNRSRLHYQLANLHALRLEPGAMALLLDERGFVAEGTGSNVFMAREGEVLTPKPHDILRGVSRQACVDYAKLLGIAVREVDIDPYDVRTADEVWITSTPFAILPVTRFDFRTVGKGVPGEIYSRILKAWSEDVGVNISRQAEEYRGLSETWTP
ncbi:MAG: branched-chain amino acid aminotransferase [Gemmatimonadetes bacterium]|nr:branched-chain amino acid aminotransferase [Gemmatimonadota bacterium]